MNLVCNHRGCPRLRLIAGVVLGLALTLIVASLVSQACEAGPLIWIPRDPTADALYRFVKYSGKKKYGKAGYIDQTGKIVIPLSLPYLGFTDADEFHDGRLEIAVWDGVYVNTRGEKVIGHKFERGWHFSEGLAAAFDKPSQRWGYINTKGQFAIQPQFASDKENYVWSFSEGLAMIKIAGEYGYIDHSGKFAIPPRFLWADSFSDGMARVVVEGPCVYGLTLEEYPCPYFGITFRGSENQQQPLPACKYTFVDKSGRLISDQRFESVRPFSEGLAPVRVGRVWGFIDKRGVMVISPQFESAAPFSEGLAMISRDHKFGFIDRDGGVVIEPQFKYAEDFAQGVAVVGDLETGFTYIDKNGNSAFAQKYVLASSFFKGLAHVKLNGNHVPGEVEGGGTFAYIDRTGRQVFTYEP